MPSVTVRRSLTEADDPLSVSLLPAEATRFQKIVALPKPHRQHDEVKPNEIIFLLYQHRVLLVFVYHRRAASDPALLDLRGARKSWTREDVVQRVNNDHGDPRTH